MRGVRVQRPPSSPGAPLEVRCEHLTIFSPNGEVLIKGSPRFVPSYYSFLFFIVSTCSHVDASLDLQSSVLVTGVAGSGKTSLLRVLAGIWPTFTGKVILYALFLSSLYYPPKIIHVLL